MDSPVVFMAAVSSTMFAGSVGLAGIAYVVGRHDAARLWLVVSGAAIVLFAVWLIASLIVLGG